MKKVIATIVGVSIICAGGIWVWSGINQKKNVDLLLASLKKQNLIKVTYDSAETSIWTHCTHISNMKIDTTSINNQMNPNSKDIVTFFFKTKGNFTLSYNVFKNAFILEFPEEVDLSGSTASEGKIFSLQKTGYTSAELKLDSRSWMFKSLENENPLTLLKGLSIHSKDVNLFNKKTNELLISVADARLHIDQSILNDKHKIAFSGYIKDLTSVKLVPSLDQKGEITFNFKPDSPLVGKTNTDFKIDVTFKPQEIKEMKSGKSNLTFAEVKIDKLNISNDIHKTTLETDILYSPEKIKVKLDMGAKVSKQYTAYVTGMLKDNEPVFDKFIRDARQKNPQVPALKIEDIIAILPDCSQWGQTKFEVDVNINPKNMMSSEGKIKYVMNDFDLFIDVKPGKPYETILKFEDTKKFINDVSRFATKISNLIAPEFSSSISHYTAIALDMAPKLIEQSKDSKLKETIKASLDLTQGPTVNSLSANDLMALYAESVQKNPSLMAPPPPASHIEQAAPPSENLNNGGAANNITQ